jgi:hypothetical protein
MLVIMQMKFKNAEHALQKLFSALPLGNKNINIKKTPRNTLYSFAIFRMEHTAT